MESTREQVRRRADVAPDEVDDVVAIAAELQDADREKAAAPSVDEVEAVARELDVDPKYVEQALRVHRDRKADAERARVDADHRRAEIAARARRIAAAVAVGLALLGGGGLVSAWSASGRIAAAHAEVERTEQGLAAVLDREASLSPQLVALAGGEWTPPQPVAQNAPIDERLRAADDLGRSLAAALAALPPASDPAASQERLNLQYELTGTQNRITVERRRWEDARAAEREADRGIGAAIAHRIGL